MTTPIAAPQLFALTRDGDDPNQIIGYGMVLPDGTAHSVSWSAEAGAGGTQYSASSAEQTAELRRAKLHWIGDPA
jgi:hypothetical protein